MSLDKYFGEIETIEFQVQYSVLSGFRSVLDGMSEDKTLVQLCADLQRSPESCQAVFYRIKRLLQEYDIDGDMPIDESVAAYLYCLWKVDTATALEASKSVLDAGGQWWSVQLAMHILQQAQSEPA
ncbi:MAG: hypothetical protein OXE52_21275 [Chloroflexi bacterium]|nr:hypothetical protein [Chloroflexota bacterium]